ncbi:MAG: Bax inhibitor-1/YccA family protein, partial [Thermoanaerobaculia bacterium]
MFGGLLLTALASMWVVSSPAMQQIVLGNRVVLIGLLLAELGIVIFAGAKLNTMTPAAAATCFLVYSLLTGLTLSVIFFVYSRTSIVQAFAATAGMFGAMSIYARVTKRSLASWGSFLFMGVIGIIIAMVVNMFIASSALSMAI